jgi:hypothetical protein
LADPAVRVFRRSPFRLLVLAVGCLALASVSGSALRQEGASLHAFVLAAALIGALWLAWRSILIWRTSGDELRLDRDGFTLCREGSERRVPWREVPSRFRSVHLWFNTVIAWTSDGSDPPRGYFGYQARAARGQVQSIPGDYHWNPYLLARILNRTRRRALAED